MTQEIETDQDDSNELKHRQNSAKKESLAEILIDPSFKSNLTIVVATVGESTLEDLIKSIEESTLLPLEVILSFPPKSDFNKYYVSEKFKIRKINSDRRGQVHQRCYALNYVNTPLVLQVDADIVFHQDTIKTLVDSLTGLGKGNVVSPMIHKIYRPKSFFGKCFESLRCLIIDGSFRINVVKITKAGVPYFLEDLVYSEDCLVVVEWFHSVRLYYIEEAVRHHYYPFAGKAYFEDVIQALEFRKKNVKLWAVPIALVEHRPLAYSQELENDAHLWRAQRWITATYGFSKFRLEMYYFVLQLRQFIMKLFRG